MDEARRAMCAHLFGEMGRVGIPYAILDGSAPIPPPLPGDIDVVVPDRDLDRVRDLIWRVSRTRGWMVVQSIPHEATATFILVANPREPEQRLAIDIRSHVTRGSRRLVDGSAVLRDRIQRDDGYVAASPASECVYLLVKASYRPADAITLLERARQIRRQAPVDCEIAFAQVFGTAAPRLEQWLDHPGADLSALRAHLRASHPPSSRLRLRRTVRLARRLQRPPGVHLVVLGPDGAGKTTLAERIAAWARPQFSACQITKFRPDLLHRIGQPSDPEPHARPPRSRAASWAKVVYYFGDSLLGWALRIRPAMAMNRCVVFDRAFDDLLVDQRRYLVCCSRPLVQLLRGLLPPADLTFVLDASPAVISERRSELPIPELERQREAYRQLAASHSRYRLLAADRPAEAVARDACHEILTTLAARHYPEDHAKRLMDLAVAAAAIALLSPVLLGVGLAVRIKLGSPVLFHQQRPGRGGVPFMMVKFRTMRDLRLANGRMRPDAERMTRFGTLLRRTSLDELPELLNVIRGEMSLVGPRPLLMEYLPRYTDEQARRHEVRPGITGWAQIHGRNTADWPTRLALDTWYVDNRSPWLDARILLDTVVKVVRREGITVAGSGAESRFLGNAQADGGGATR